MITSDIRDLFIEKIKNRDYVNNGHPYLYTFIVEKGECGRLGCDTEMWKGTIRKSIYDAVMDDAIRKSIFITDPDPFLEVWGYITIEQL